MHVFWGFHELECQDPKNPGIIYEPHMVPNETRLALNNQPLRFQLNVIYDFLSTSEHNEVQIDTNGSNY